MGQTLLDQLKRHAAKLKREFKVTFSEKLLKRMIDLNDRMIPGESQPGKTLKAMEDMARRFGPANPERDETVELAMTRPCFVSG